MIGMENQLFQNKYRIKSTRLKHWDYSSSGAYYVTICTQVRKYFFGKIINGKMMLSKIGEIVEYEWKQTCEMRENVELDEYVIMPDHMHGILIICNSHRREVARNVSTMGNIMSRISPKSNSLSVIIRSFKSAVSNWCHKNNFNYFQWQSRFHEHIIRDEIELNQKRNYIINNPLKWELNKKTLC